MLDTLSAVPTGSVLDIRPHVAVIPTAISWETAAMTSMMCALLVSALQIYCIYNMLIKSCFFCSIAFAAFTAKY